MFNIFIKYIIIFSRRTFFMKAKKKGLGFFGEFKTFITRGNVVDLAVGVIIGGAFTAIVTALTNHIFQPLINWLISACGGTGALDSARTILGNPVYTDETKTVIDWASTNYIDWGAFISAIINFLLVALILFAIVKAINTANEKKLALDAKLKEEYYKKHPEERPAPVEEAKPAPTELDVLNEIKDLLKEKKK